MTAKDQASLQKESEFNMLMWKKVAIDEKSKNYHRMHDC